MKNITILIAAVLFQITNCLSARLLNLWLITLLMSGLLPTFSSAQRIDGGRGHSLAVCSDGTTRSWGQDSTAQLGDGGTNTNQPTSVTVASLTGIVAVAAGQNHSLALKNDSTVWSWGDDADGQLGDGGTNTNQSTPVQVASLTGIIAIAAGSYHSLALKSDGSVWSWGFDGSGQLGNGAVSTSQPTPVQVVALTDIIAISAGHGHCLALKNDSTVWSWGWDNYGQLGDGGSNTNQPAPVVIASLTGISAIAAGFGHSLALKTDGTVWSCGRDFYGQLGDGGTNTNKNTPVAVASLTGITAIAAGWNHSLALKDNGIVWSWGSDAGGQLGNDVSFVQQPTPVAVASLTGITAIAGGESHSLALKNDGTVWSFGWDKYGQLGDNATYGAPADDKPTPVQVIPLCNVSLISTPSICLVTVDSLSEYNIIVWDKTFFTSCPLDSFIIYRDTANNNYAPIGKVPYDSLSQFIDTVRSLYGTTANGDPNTSSWRYKIAAKDSCGNMSAMSPYHQTMFMQNTGGDFSWSHYEIEGQTPGQPVAELSQYLFRRDDTNTGNYVTAAALPAASVGWTDPTYTALQGTANWTVKTLWSISCTPSLKNPQPMVTTVNNTKSNNYRLNNPTSTNEISLENVVSIFPNPNKGEFKVQGLPAGQAGSRFKVQGLEVYNLYGEKVHSESVYGASYMVHCTLPDGIYFAHIKTEFGMIVKKIVVAN